MNKMATFVMKVIYFLKFKIAIWKRFNENGAC